MNMITVIYNSDKANTPMRRQVKLTESRFCEEMDKSRKRAMRRSHSDLRAFCGALLTNIDF